MVNSYKTLSLYYFATILQTIIKTQIVCEFKKFDNLYLQFTHDKIATYYIILFLLHAISSKDNTIILLVYE